MPERRWSYDDLHTMNLPRDAALDMLDRYLSTIDEDEFGWVGSEDDYEDFLAYVEDIYPELTLNTMDREMLIDVYIDAFRAAEP